MKVDYIKSLDKTFSMVYQAIGEEAFVKMIETMLQTGDSKISLMERSDVEVYKKRNSITSNERVPEEIY